MPKTKPTAPASRHDRGESLKLALAFAAIHLVWGLIGLIHR